MTWVWTYLKLKTLRQCGNKLKLDNSKIIDGYFNTSLSDLQKSGEDRKIKLYNQLHLIDLEKITPQSRNSFCQ